MLVKTNYFSTRRTEDRGGGSDEAEDGDWGPEEKARMMQRGTDCGLMTGKLIVSTGEHFNPHLETSLPCQSGG